MSLIPRRIGLPGFVVAIIALTALVFYNRGIQSNIYKILEKPARLLVSLAASLESSSAGIFRSNELVLENRRLEAERAKLESLAAENEALKRQNELLRRQLKVSENLDFELIMAKITLIQRNPGVSVIVINKGSRDGVVSRDTVIAAGNIVLGSVDEVFDSFSRVLLIDDHRMSTSIRVIGSDALANARGSGSSRLKLDLISSSENVIFGDLLITSGLDSFPEGLIVGVIESAEVNSGTLFQKVEARAGFDLTDSHVFIVHSAGN